MRSSRRREGDEVTEAPSGCLFGPALKFFTIPFLAREVSPAEVKEVLARLSQTPAPPDARRAEARLIAMAQSAPRTVAALVISYPYPGMESDDPSEQGSWLAAAVALSLTDGWTRLRLAYALMPHLLHEFRRGDEASLAERRRGAFVFAFLVNSGLEVMPAVIQAMADSNGGKDASTRTERCLCEVALGLGPDALEYAWHVLDPASPEDARVRKLLVEFFSRSTEEDHGRTKVEF